MQRSSLGGNDARAPRPVSRPFEYKGSVLCCDGLSLDALASEFGTPMYVYAGDQILSRFQLYESSFSNQAHTVCYAVKANSSLAVLQMLGRRGAGFDIVSGGELERVRRACPEALSRVVFSGVGKQSWEIDAALQAEILLFNVESEAELGLLADRAEANGVRARFGLRVNPDVFAETHPYISTGLREHKFGIDIETARVQYRLAAERSSLDPAAVSVHIGSQIRAVEPFAAALERVASLVQTLRADGHNIRYVDVGGGLGIDYSSGDSFDPVSEMQKYASALLPMLSDLEVHLLLEPGRFIVGQAGGLLTRVLSVKTNGSKSFIIADAGMNDLIRPSLYQAHHEIWPVRQPLNASVHTFDVVGPVCESGDFFARDRSLPKMEAGDLALILDAGAYGMSLASNYNSRARPPEVLVEAGAARLIRRREALEELWRAELI